MHLKIEMTQLLNWKFSVMLGVNKFDVPQIINLTCDHYR